MKSDKGTGDSMLVFMASLVGVIFILVSIGCRSGGVVASDVTVSGSAGRPFKYWFKQARSSSPERPAREIISALVEAYGSDDEDTQVAAVDGLRRLAVNDPRDLNPALTALSLERPPYILCGLAEALAARGAPMVTPIMELLSDYEDRDQRWTFCVYTLSMIGHEAEPALAYLRKSIGEEGFPEGLRDFVVDCIWTIEHDVELARGKRDALKAVAVPKAAVRPVPVGGQKGVGWPGYHGPRRDNRSIESGLAMQWPADGPPLLWRLRGLGSGYSNVAIVDGRLYTMGDFVGGNGEMKQSVVAFDLDAQKQVWRTAIGDGLPGPSPGPRCTPSVSDGRVFALGTGGTLVCLRADNGQIVWKLELVDKFNGAVMGSWHYSESPLVDGDRVVVTPGGPPALMAALDASKGTVIWRCEEPENVGPAGCNGAGYASISVAEIHGVRQYVQQVGRGLVGVAAEDGRLLWHYNRIASRTANIGNPIIVGHRIFVSNSYGRGSALLEITRDGEEWRADEVYFLRPRVFENHHGGIVRVGSLVFGGSGQNRGDPCCVHMPSGRVLWRAKAPSNGSASVTYADGHIIWRYDRGEVFVTRASSDGWNPVGRLAETRERSGARWTHPVVYDGRLYLRHHDTLSCYSLTDETRTVSAGLP